MARARGWIVRAVILAVCLVGLAWTVAALGPGRIAEAAAGADPGWLALSALAMVARYLVWGAKWTGMMRRQGPIGFAAVTRALMAGVFVNLTTPTAKLAGGFVRAALVNRETAWGLAGCYGWSLADQITNVLGLLVLASALLLGLGALRSGPEATVFLASGAAGLLLATGVVAIRNLAWRGVRRPGPTRWLARLTPSRFRTLGPGGPTAGWLEPTLAPLLAVGSTWRVAPRDLGLAALSYSMICASNAFALRAVGLDVAFVEAAAAVVLAGLAGTLVGTVGGIGATELALIGLYGRMDVPVDAAAAGALLHRAAYYAVSLGLGGIALLWEGRRRKAAP